MFPSSNARSAPIQILTTTSLTKVEGILPKEAMAIGDAMIRFSATGTHNSPSVSSVRTMVPEEHAGMPPALKHFKSDQMPPTTHLWPGLETFLKGKRGKCDTTTCLFKRLRFVDVAGRNRSGRRLRLSTKIFPVV